MVRVTTLFLLGASLSITPLASANVVGATPVYPGLTGPSSGINATVGSAVSIGSYTITDSSNIGWSSVVVRVSVTNATVSATSSGTASVSGSGTSTLVITGSISDAQNTLNSATVSRSNTSVGTLTISVEPNRKFSASGNTYYFWNGNGHYYRFVPKGNFANRDAMAANAASVTFAGAGGYLLTLTGNNSTLSSAEELEEQDFIVSTDILSANKSSRTYGAAALTAGVKCSAQPSASSTSCTAANVGTFYWVTGSNSPTHEQRATVKSSSGNYPWMTGEPNGSAPGLAYSGWYSDSGTFTRNGSTYSNAFLWDDFPIDSQFDGAIYEFGNNTFFEFTEANRIQRTVTNVDLSSLTISQGTFSPSFLSSTTSYTVSVANDVSSVTITPTRADAGGTISVNGSPVTSGSVSGNINLNVGSNTINVVVTAASGATKTYTITVTRANNAALTPTFGTPTPTADGFAVSIANYTTASNNTNYTWAVSASPGTASLNTSTGLVTVTGVNPNTSSTLTVTTSRALYNNGSATVSATSLNSYTVTFSAGTGATGSNQTLTKTHGSALTLPSSLTANGWFTKSGETVIGWSTSNGGSITSSLGGTYSTESATTFYPVWGCSASGSSVVASGLILHLDTDSSCSTGTSGKWRDISGNGRDLTWVNAATSRTDNGAYYEFIRASSHYGTLSSDGLSNFTSGISVTFWARFDATTGVGWERIIDFGNGPASENIFVAREGTTNRLIVDLLRGNTSGVRCKSAIITDGQWAHFAVTVDASGNCAIYKNGISQTLDENFKGSSPYIPINTTRANNYIGDSNWVADAFFDGGIGDLAIYNRGLSSSEVSTNFSAQAVVSYTITLNKGTTGTGSNQTLTKTQGQTLVLPNSATANSYFTRTGYTVSGWTTTDGGSQTHALGGNFTTDSVTTLYPVWAANTYNVTYDEKGGSTVSDGTFITGGAISLPTPPTRSGFTFGGWSTTDGGTTAVTVPYSPGVTNNITLYAIWAANAQSPTITSQPISRARVVGESVTFSVSATSPDGGTLSYQWQKGGIDIAGATSASYSPAILDSSVAGSYTVVVTNSLNGTSATSTSNAALLAIAGTNYHRNFVSASPGSAGTQGRSYKSSSQVIPSGNFTLEGWFNEASNASGQNPVFSQSSYFSNVLTLHVLGGSRTLALFYRDNPVITGASPTALAKTKWHHYAVTYDGSTLRLYLNGALEASSNISAATFTGGSFQIGESGYYTSGNNSHYFHGKQDQVKIWSGALTQAEIASSMHSYGDGGVSGKILRSLYDFNQREASLNDVLGGFNLTELGIGNSNSWISSSLNVTFDEQGGSSVTDATFDFYTKIADPGVPTKANSTFDGWSRSSNGTVISYPYIFAPLEPTTLYAIWTSNTVTITFNANDGSGTPATSTQSISSGVATALTSNAFTRTGYTFAGWNTLANGTGTNYTNQQSVTLSGNLTLYAKWTANTYTVTYVYNNADGAPRPATDSFTVGGSAVVLPTPTRTGYTFAGWYAEIGLATSIGSAGANYSPTDNVTIYAKWTANSNTVTFKSNYVGGANDVTQSIVTAVATGLTSNAFTRTGYVFVGWNTLADGTGTNYTDGQSVTLVGALTLYAKWTAGTYTVTFNYNSATGGASVASGSYTTGGSNLTLPVPTRTGYTFAGWYDESNFSGSALASSITTSASKTIHAKWTANDNLVTFKANYVGGASDSTQTIVSGTATALTSNAFTRTGFTFGGWTTNADGTGTSYTNGQSVTITGPLTLHAKWNAATYTITYSYNSATGGNSVPTASFTTGGVAINLPTPTRAGYVFAGWYEASDFSGSQLGSTYSPTQSRTIYAKWTAGTYNILYEYNGATSGNTTTSNTFTTGGSNVTLPTPARTGYNFGGWYESSTFDNNAVSSSYSTTQNRSLFAKWNPINYTVTYNGDIVVSGNTISPTSGSVPTNNTNYNIGQNLIVAANSGSLARTGFTFAGWVTNQDGTGTALNSGQTIQFSAANINLYPKWTPNTYTISYNLNGGSGDLSSAPTSWSADQAGVTLPSSGFTRTGYNFGGWAISQGGAAVPSNNFTTLSNVTLIAVWTLKTINYSFDKGTAGSANIANWPSNSSASFGTTITLPNLASTQVTIGGGTYLFFGWSHSGSTYNSGASFTLGETAPTFTAQWVQVFDVRYGFGGGTHSVAGDKDPACITEGLCLDTQVITLRSAPTKDGHTFSGWRVQDTVTVKQAGASHTISASQYLFYANWTAVDYVFSFSSNGGSVLNAPETKNIGQLVTLPSPGVKTGHTFAGWSDDAGTTKYSVGTSLVVGAESRTFAAYWTPNVYTVVFDWQGSVGTPSANASYTVGTGNLSLPAVGDHVRDGYTFAGWAESPGGTVLTNFQPTGNDVLYAVWNDGNYTLSYDGKGGNVGSGNGTVRRTQAVTLPTPVRNGFVFNGWYDHPSSGNRVGSGGQSITPDRSKSLYARWTQKSLSGVDPATLEQGVTAPLNEGNSFRLEWDHANSNSGAVIQVPAGALPTGTNLNVQYFRDTSRQSDIIPGENSYFFAVLVSWLTGSGDTATVPNTAAGKPIEVTLTNSSIKAGAMAYMVLGTEVRELGRATQDGTITVQLTEDPEIVVAATAPGAPASVVASSADASATVSWAAPSNNGGATITGYTVTASPGGASCTTATTSCTVTGLTNGTAYTFSVVATNSVGNSAAATSSSVTPALATYTVTFNSNGGSSVASGSFTTGGSVSEPTAPTRSGFTFDGWSTVQNSVPSKVTFPYSPGVNNNITLYALWTQVQQSGGGSGGSGGGSTPVVTPTPTPRPTPTPGPSAPPSQIGFVPTPPATPVAQTGPVGAVKDSGERVTFVADQPGQTLIATAGAVRIEVKPPVVENVSRPVTDKLELVFQVASQASLSGTGLQPNTVVEAWVFSEPTYVGTIKVGPTGAFDTNLALPKNLLPGKHTLQIGTVNSSGRLVTLSMPITVKGSVSVGTFKGFIAIYSTELEGQEITAKVAGKWIRQNPVARFKNFPYSRLVRFTGAGYNIKIDVYINKKFYKQFTTRTR